MARLLTGKPVKEMMAQNMTARIAALHEVGVTPTLAMVRVGSRPDDMAYESAVMHAAEAIGIRTRQVTLEDDCTQAQVIAELEGINANDNIHGCLLFRPLPKRMDEEAVCNTLVPGKDIDGITDASLAGVFTGAQVGFAPSTADACMKVLDYYEVPLEGRRVTVVGRSLVVGKPVAMMLLGRHATVTLCHSRTPDVAQVTREADIVVLASGRPREYGAAYFRAGQTVIDVGINFDANGVMCGDADLEAASEVVDAITPVPGGVGPVTTATTLLHTVEAAEVIAKEQTRITIARLM